MPSLSCFPILGASGIMLIHWQSEEQTQAQTLCGVCDLAYTPVYTPGMTHPLTVVTWALCLPEVLAPQCFEDILLWALIMGVENFLILLHQQQKAPPKSLAWLSGRRNLGMPHHKSQEDTSKSKNERKEEKSSVKYHYSKCQQPRWAAALQTEVIHKRPTIW